MRANPKVLRASVAVFLLLSSAPALAAPTVKRATNCSVTQIEASFWSPSYILTPAGSSCTPDQPCSWFDTKITFACASGELLLWVSSYLLERVAGAQLNQSLNTGKKLKEVGYWEQALTWADCTLATTSYYRKKCEEGQAYWGVTPGVAEVAKALVSLKM